MAKSNKQYFYSIFNYDHYRDQIESNGIHFPCHIIKIYKRIVQSMPSISDSGTAAGSDKLNAHKSGNSRAVKSDMISHGYIYIL